MKLLIAFLLGCFLIGGSIRGRIVRERPLVLLALSTVVAAGYWSLRIAS